MLILSTNLVIFLSIIYTIYFIIFLKDNKTDAKKAKCALIIYFELLIFTYLYSVLQNMYRVESLFIVSVIVFSGITITILNIFKLYKKEYNIVFLFFIAISVLLGYISYTPFFLRQHDGRNFYKYQNGGNFGYIGYIFYNNHLPNFSPRDYWCFSNPPLFYIISACYIKLQNFFGREIDNCIENLQLLTFIYTTILYIYVYKILKSIKIEKSLLSVLCLIFFVPAVIIMSGSINNDILSIMLQAMAIFYTIKWKETDKLSDLIKIAITISFAMMTKISSAVIAVAIAYVFLRKVLENKEKFKQYLLHFTIFAIIALPIGLWFPIKNLILYDIPLTYVQSVDLGNQSNITEYSAFERVFTIKSKEQLYDVNVILAGENRDYNLFFSTLKSFVVDEKIDYEENKVLDLIVHSIFYLSILISIIYIVNIIIVLKDYKKIKNEWILFALILLILEIISYIKFCFDYPFTFTMNFRYIIPTLISYGIITGIASDRNKKVFWVNTILNTTFCFLSIIMFILLQ